jgi:hypothetical protein
VLLEDQTSECSRVLLENHSLRRHSSTQQATITQLESVAERFKVLNKELQRECEELRFRWEVAEKLRGQMKVHFQKYVNKALSTTSATTMESNIERDESQEDILHTLLKPIPNQSPIKATQEVTDYTYDLTGAINLGGSNSTTNRGKPALSFLSEEGSEDS